MSESENNRLIEEIDAIGNLKIEVWSDDFQHALEGHPEVTIERVRSALKNPVKVVQSKYSAVACLFYSYECCDEKEGASIYFCVVVALFKEGKAKLETAYEKTYMKAGTVLFERGK